MKLQNTKRNERENPKAAKRIDKAQNSNSIKIGIYNFIAPTKSWMITP